MTAIIANGITIEYEEKGDKRDPAIILIRGLGTQLVETGLDTAAHIPGASLEIIEGMGHNIPDALVPRFIELISAHARKAQPL